METLTTNWGIIGHEWIVSLLSDQLTANRPGHAYLFAGLPQIGKTTLAVRFAQAMNCTGGRPPCGECRPCTLIAKGAHPDIIVVEPDGRSIKIEAVRQLQQSMTLRPIEAHHRVAIIPDAQLLTDQAADALLKTLEEPPPTSRLLLTIDDANNILQTVVSRCRVINFRPVPESTIADSLTVYHQITPEDAALYAHLSGGRPGWAISVAEDPSALETRDSMLNMLVELLHSDRAGRFAYSEELSRSANRDLVLETWQSWWRDIFLLVENSRVPLYNMDRQAELEELSYAISQQGVRDAINAIRKTIDALNKNANARLAVDVMFLDFPYI